MRRSHRHFLASHHYLLPSQRLQSLLFHLNERNRMEAIATIHMDLRCLGRTAPCRLPPPLGPHPHLHPQNNNATILGMRLSVVAMVSMAPGAVRRSLKEATTPWLALISSPKTPAARYDRMCQVQPHSTEAIALSLGRGAMRMRTTSMSACGSKKTTANESGALKLMLRTGKSCQFLLTLSNSRAVSYQSQPTLNVPSVFRHTHCNACSEFLSEPSILVAAVSFVKNTSRQPLDLEQWSV